MAELIDFRVTFVPNRYGDQLQRRVGLLPLTGPIRAGRGLEGDVAAKTLRVVEQWRARIPALGHAGWSPFAGDGEKAARDRTYAANCVPSFAAVKEPTRHCGRAPCPFCWSRWALKVWESTDYAFFASPEARRAAGADAARKLTRAPFDLILLSTSNPFPRRAFDAETGNVEDTLPGVLSRAIDRRGRWFQLATAKMGVLGGLYVSTITPEGPAWRASTSRLLIIPPGVEPPPDWSKPAGAGAKSTIRIYRHPAREVVMAAVARACRYPKSWMTGEPEDIVAILDACAKLRLSATFGLLRNRSARAREAAAATRPDS